MALQALEGGAEALTLDLWLWRLSDDPDHPDHAAALSAHLAPEEHARAARLVRDQDRLEFQIARGRMREILGGYLGCAPRDVPLSVGANGKPLLREGAEGHGPSFNLSHAGGWAALVTGPHGLPLGIDIEPHRKVEPDLPERFFSRAEQADLAQLAGADWTAGFFNAWVRKEALLKALGSGLSRPLDSFDVTLKPGEPAVLRSLSGAVADRWTFLALELRPDFPGCIAFRPIKPAGGTAPETRLTIREGSLPLPS